MKNDILLIGQRRSVLSALADALAEDNLQATYTTAITTVHLDFNGSDYALVAFGRGVSSQQQATIRSAFTAQNPRIRFVEGIAPIIPLLKDQIRISLAQQPNQVPLLSKFDYTLTYALRVLVDVRHNCSVTLTIYHLNSFFKSSRQALLTRRLTAGKHILSVDRKQLGNFGTNFLVLTINDSELYVRTCNVPLTIMKNLLTKRHAVKTTLLRSVDADKAN
ncbi:hypothetical protein DYU11_09530 [Fibrisoma montanum]|uniref:Uncharacterized protein n=1 Tax=Fibrisoma montanum TaxID=2305895 RepID=A0A418MFJ1_9BACT|nr:hypothetical protein [Fibrisoma montanum]RIV25527.1 hypothetical protein DYU11_09530 [Fibrisoma montanum]